jgi:hypothetical protein
MKTSWIEPAYEPLRIWALHPSPTRPPGVAQILRGGIITWLRQTQPLPVVSSCEPDATHVAPCLSTPLSTIVAAMIAEVCQ